MKAALFIKKDKPGAEDVIRYMKDRFERLSLFEGQRGEKFPESAFKVDQDVLVSYLAPWVVPKAILNKTVLWNINFHPGPPEYPGIGCFNFAIYNGEKSYGVTAHIMEEKVDSGGIIAVRRFEVSEEESVYSLSMKSYRHMLKLFIEVMDSVLINKKLPESGEAWARTAYKRSELEALCRIDPDMTKDEVERRVKATKYPGMPGAYIEVDGRRREYGSDT